MDSLFEARSANIHCHYHSIAVDFLAQQRVRPVNQNDIDPWRQGRQRYWCWCIEVSSDPIMARIERQQRRLNGLILPSYQRQPHVTLAVCGFWQSSPLVSPSNDDFFEDDLQRQLSLIADFPWPSFELRVLGTNSFASAPFLEVIDSSLENKLQRLRDCLSPQNDDFRSIGYCPHITLGLFHRALAISELHFLLSDPSDREPIPLSVSALSLMSYDSRDLAGALQLERRIDLDSHFHREKNCGQTAL